LSYVVSLHTIYDMLQKRPPIYDEESKAAVLNSTGIENAENYHPCQVKDQNKGFTHYAWIGAGLCGGRLVKSFYDLGYQSVLAVSTKEHDLDTLNLPRSQKLLIGNGENKQTATNIEETSQIVKHHRQDILHLARQTFAANIDRVMICFGAAGNTGSGSVIELIDIAKTYARSIGIKNPNRNVGVIMTLPASDEIDCPFMSWNAYTVSSRLCQMAEEGQISPLIIVDNEKVGKMHSGMTSQSLWSSINRTVASLFDTFNRLSSMSSPYTCFDPADYNSIMSSGGCLIMGAAKVDRLDDSLAISKAAESSLQTTLFAGGEDLSTAKVAGCIVVGGNELMAHIKGLQDNIDYAFDILSEVTGRATAYRGIYEDDMDGLNVYTIIGGLNTPIARLKELDIEDSHFAGSHFPIFPENGVPAKTAKWGPDPSPLPEVAYSEQKRQDEILASAERFLAKQADAHGGRVKTLSQDTRMILLSYSWPGNNLELADAIKHAYNVTEGSQIPPEALPFEIIFANMELFSDNALPALDEVKLWIASKEYDEFIKSLS
jgi:cell division GTPase FtsZ